ncbi:hypothetical protein J2T16_005164 [Paenibacillus intestini]|uniref:Uncharacterized protein n=1 Tax=Paenibacillus cucumis (ex Kampfer et al. 2016) TaxID=1776858 RepID=A0ABS7KHR3_9BACL|nr:hypothetical protein [Paenibacillus cucumis (ex Kampfer et al. 2016)]MBY0203672.1 hypothetical protein [Paenibacillus cucumis (ex Kampfer et al. 2016)]MDP9702187.1 hypothetical protein [Paenibacillus intestini]
MHRTIPISFGSNATLTNLTYEQPVNLKNLPEATIMDLEPAISLHNALT